ncbi:MAG: EamA family transporter [Clostridia bacterium]|nr:EamA family transporter [Clostridia bacterium]
MFNEQNKARISLIISMFVFGTIGIFRRYIPLPSGILAMARGFIGALFLTAAILLGKKGFDTKAIKKNLPLLLISGAMIGFNWILLFEAYNYTSVATATLCYYTAPIFVILASPLLLREKLSAKKMICVAVSVLGMILVSGILDADFSGIKELTGVFLGLGAALLYASVVIMNKKIKNLQPYDKTIIQLGSAALVLLPYTLFAEDISSVKFDLTSAAMLLTVGIIHTGIAYAMYFGSMDKLKAQTAALFSYIDPVIAIILSALILKENIGVSGYIGAALILGATLISEIPEKKCNENC